MHGTAKKDQKDTRKLTFMLDEEQTRKMRARHIVSPLEKHLAGMGRHYPPQQKTAWQD